MRPRLIPPRTGGTIAALAARQHGVVSREQLARLGMSDSAIARRIEAGGLHRLHVGVYAVGHTGLSQRGRWMAAVLACGPAAALSHHSAAALWQLRGVDPSSVHVTVPRTGARSRPGLRIHRPRTLRDEEVTAHHGVPVTTPARTLLDLAPTLAERDLQQTLEEAVVRRLVSVPSLDALARAHPGHHGKGKLKRALEEHTPGTTLTRSDLEERFLALCKRYGLRRPRVNASVAGLTVDFLFERERLIVETDGWRFHGHRAAFERDRRRDAALTRAGYRTLRFTHDQLATEPASVVATIAAARAA
jgi:very-short-patch-repair endonuclease